jgi:hypothetical protein
VLRPCDLEERDRNLGLMPLPGDLSEQLPRIGLARGREQHERDRPGIVQPSALAQAVRQPDAGLGRAGLGKLSPADTGSEAHRLAVDGHGAAHARAGGQARADEHTEQQDQPATEPDARTARRSHGPQ